MSAADKLDFTSIACPKCGALEGEQCKSARGKYQYPGHAARVELVLAAAAKLCEP